MERRLSMRTRKNFSLSDNILALIRILSDKHGISESGVISSAVVQWADREGLKPPEKKEES